MAFDGAGNYALPSPEFPAVSGEHILAATYNTILTDIANALSLVLVRDGQAPMAANLNMGSHKITNLLAGVANTDAVTVAQVLTTTITALKALTPAADRMIYFSDATTAALLTTTSFGRSLLSLANAAALRTAIGAEPADATILKDADIGVTVQGYDATTLKAANIGNTVQAHSSVLDLLTAVTPVSGKVPYFTGSPVSVALASLGAFGLTMLGQASASSTLDALGVSAFIKTLLNNADAATARTTLGALATNTVYTTAIDWNTFTTPGLYGIYAASCTNPPIAGTLQWGLLVLQPYNSNNVIQVAFRSGTTDIYIRSRVSATWGSWAKVGEQVSPKILTFTRDMSSASGNVDYTGLEFQPRAALVIAGSDSPEYGSIGFDDGTNRGCFMRHPTNWAQLNSSYSVMLFKDLSNAQVGTMSMLSDGVRISWTKTGSPTGSPFGRILCFK